MGSGTASSRTTASAACCRERHKSWEISSGCAEPGGGGGVNDLLETATQRAGQDLDLRGDLPQTQLVVRVAVTPDRFGQPSGQPHAESQLDQPPRCGLEGGQARAAGDEVVVCGQIASDEDALPRHQDVVKDGERVFLVEAGRQRSSERSATEIVRLATEKA